MAFIGRERELAVLGAALQRAAEGEPARVIVSSDLGMGTSRLMDELVARVADLPDVVVCRGVCYEPESGIAYAALRRALAPALESTPDSQLASILGAGAYDIAVLMPEVGERLRGSGAVVEPPALDSPRQRGARVREALLGVIDRLAGRGQVVLIIEDLEHSDPGTRELVGALMRTSRRIPLTLVVSCHPGEISRAHPARPFVDELAVMPGVERLELQPLTSEEIASVAETAIGERPTIALLAALIEGSRGNPLLAEQLIAAQQTVAGARLADPLAEIVEARLEALDENSLRVLRVLAAARRPLPAEQLGSVTLPDGHLPRDSATLATATGLAEERDGGVAISHVLLSEAIERAQLPAQRHVMHAALAVLADRAANAAWHWVRAGRVDEARAAHLLAASRQRNVEPGATTLGHLVAALELADAGAVLADDVEVLEAAAVAADAAGSFRRAAGLCSQAIERLAGGRIERLAGARTDPALRARAASLAEQLGRYRRSSGDSEGASAAFEQALSVAPESARARAAALAALAQQQMLEGDFDASVVRAEQARRAAEVAGADARPELAHATDTLAVDAGFTGQIERSLTLLDEALAIARAVGDLDEVMRCYANKTTVLDLDLRREQALAVVKEGIAEAARNGLGLTYGAFLGGNAADILFQLGRWTEAEQQCRAATEFPPAGVAWFSPILYLGLVLVESRADEEAAQLVGRTLLQLETVPAGQWSALVLRTAVSLALWRGDLADARAAAEQGWRTVLETDDATQIVVSAATVLEACAAAADAGRLKRDWSAVAEATTLANEVLPTAEQNLARFPLRAGVGARREADLYMATARAHHERVRGRTKPETYASLAEAWAKIPVPYQVAKARWWQAQAALPTRARRAEARRALHEAWRIANDLPAAPLQAALRDLSQRGRITLPEERLVAIPIEADKQLVAVGPGLSTVMEPDAGAAADLMDRFATSQPPTIARYGLSPREYGVLLVLAEGRTNREIADRLFISERTVAVHVRRILAKLHVSGRVEAAGVAIRLGLLPEDRIPFATGRTASR
jgi:DNA-binding CsgD family transcriptional regulator/tetratricopeptide (TPR) repeat protein